MQMIAAILLIVSVPCVRAIARLFTSAWQECRTQQALRSQIVRWQVLYANYEQATTERERGRIVDQLLKD